MATRDVNITAEQAVLGAQAAAQNYGLGVAEIEDGPTTPSDIRRYLAELRLLHHIPFSYLVPDAEMLPPESIRFFYLDRNWTDATVQGVLSVGTITTTDRAQLETAYPLLQDEIDAAERTIREGSEPGPLEGEAGTITGLLLRSQAVSGWPNLHVRAYSEDVIEDDALTTEAEDHPKRMKVLRMERLAPAVLLVLFDGVPEVVHIEEPRQGIQFGVRYRADDPPESRTAFLPLRDITTGSDLLAEANVPFRPGAPGVLDLTNLRKRIIDSIDVGPHDVLDPNEFALQMLRFPYRQVFGDPDDVESKKFYELDQFNISLGFQEWQEELVDQLADVAIETDHDHG